jgi:hypothetical protein
MITLDPYMIYDVFGLAANSRCVMFSGRYFQTRLVNGSQQTERILAIPNLDGGVDEYSTGAVINPPLLLIITQETGPMTESQAVFIKEFVSL